MRLRRLLPLLLLAACNGDPSGLQPGEVVVDVTPQQAGNPPEWQAVFGVRNLSQGTLYVHQRCGTGQPPRLERRTGVSWTDVPYESICLAVVTPPAELRPGDRYEGWVPVRASGRYRLRLRVGTSAQTTWDELSPEFTVSVD